MYVGTDVSEFQRLHGAEGAPLNWQPAWPGNPAYFEMDELPADVQELFDYDPDRARQMLASAGYPDGFSTAITVTSTNPWELDEASLLQNQWAKIGVDVEIVPLESTQFTSHKYSQPNITWDGILRDGAPSANPVTYLGLFLKSAAGAEGGGGLNNYGMYSNPEVDALISQIEAELDPAEQLRLVREATVLVQRDPPAIPMAWTSEGLYWWPWLKNYYGELTVADDGSGLSPLMAHAWIDSALRAEMTR